MTITDFWAFAYERQRIWRVRRDGLPRPWTDDPILHKYRFTNVHRELDAGTIVIADAAREHPDVDVFETVYNLMIYRVFNNAAAWVEAGGWHRPSASEPFRAGMRARYARGETVFTAAWTISGLPYPGVDRLERVFWAIDRWDVRGTGELVREATSLRRVQEVLSRVPLMGQFTAFQVALDLAQRYPERLSDDEWVLAFSNSSKRAQKDYTAGGSGAALALVGASSIAEVRDARDASLASIGKSWADVQWDAKPRCTLADVEHTLCEYGKYVKLHAPAGAPRRGRVYGR